MSRGVFRLAPACLLFSALLSGTAAQAKPNYHLVGWFNTFVPGGGQLLLGNPVLAGAQAGAETGTFLWGYNLSARSPMTLDGVPENLPSPQSISKTSVLSSTTKKWVCVPNPPPSHGCTWKSQSVTTTTTSTSSVTDFSEQDITTPLYADILQEFGLKYHMVNIYNAYREAGARNVDKTSTLGLFASPFSLENLSNPWVWGGLAASAVAIAGSYYLSAKSGVNQIAPLNKQSNSLYNLTYGVILPFGSGAPEEMFYRGFLQNEMHELVSSPFFSIPMSTLAYTFSHQAADRPSAAVTGLYLGYLAHHYKGKLGPGIAYHFWADVLAGVMAIALLQRAEYRPDPMPPISFQFNF